MPNAEARDTDLPLISRKPAPHPPSAQGGSQIGFAVMKTLGFRPKPKLKTLSPAAKPLQNRRNLFRNSGRKPLSAAPIGLKPPSKKPLRRPEYLSKHYRQLM